MGTTLVRGGNRQMDSLTVISTETSSQDSAAKTSLKHQDPLKSYRESSRHDLQDRIVKAKEQLGESLLILGHHYHQDEVFQFADLTGDSFKLSRMAAENTNCRWIVFCGVHFMAETADILANSPHQLSSRDGRRVEVILPDLAAGCSMADMADLEQVEDCWDELETVMDTSDVTPVTYINSAASLKRFCGKHGGIVCTSSNAQAVLKWAFERRKRVLFFPDQHLGRNTARRMGIGLSEMVLWDPALPQGGNSEAALANARVLLWKGHCSVHQVFRKEHVSQLRKEYPEIRVLVHPECMQEVVDMADDVGSTEHIIQQVHKAPDGTRWAIGTELHLVNRLKENYQGQEVHFLSPMVCMCATMYRIDLAHLCWSLECLVSGKAENVIQVPEAVAEGSRKALERMLQVK